MAPGESIAASSRPSRPSRLRRWLDRLIASDPALDHLKTGARAVIVAGIATLALRALAQWLGQDPKLAILGIAVPMMSATMIRDPAPRRQRLSLLLAAPVAAAANAVGSLASGLQWLSGGLFVAIVFLAFEARRFGPRGNGLGMTALYAYFFALLLQSKPEGLAWQTLLLFAGYAIAGAVRFMLIADDPQAALRHMRSAMRARVAALLDTLAQGMASASKDAANEAVAAARRDIAALNALSLQIEEHLRRHACPAQPGSEDLREKMLDCEMAAEAIVSTANALAGDAQAASAGERLAALLLRLSAAVRSEGREGQPDAASLAELVADPALPLDAMQRWRLRHAVRTLSRGEAWRMPAPALAEQQRTEAGPKPEAKALFTLDAPTRQAIRAAVACLGAILAGELISSQRWYWAVVAAFLVFNRAMTPGQTLAQAWKRVLATVAGVAAGLVIAEFAQGSTALELSLLYGFIALGFYLFQAANAVFVVLLTVMLAMLYEVLGMYRPHLLTLRLAETLAGAAMAVLAARFVLPVKTGDHADAQSAALLREAATLLRCAFDAAHEDARDAVRELDRKLQALREALEPVTSGLYPAPKAARQERLRQLAILAYCVRHAYHLAERHRAGIDPETLRAMADAVAGNADALADSLEGKGSAALQPLPDEREAFPWADDTDTDPAAKSRILANWLWEANEAVRGMPREV